jgi:hypothetical protein
LTRTASSASSISNGDPTLPPINLSNSRIGIPTTGLKFLIPELGRDGKSKVDVYTQADVNRWSEYFETYGKDQ